MPVRINGEGFTVVDSPKIQVETNWSFEVAGSNSAALYLTDDGEIDPKGRFRWHTADNLLKLQQALTAVWATQTDLITVDQANKKITIHQDVYTQQGYQVEQYIKELIDRVDTLSDHVKHLVLALAEVGADLPDDLLATLDEATQHSFAPLYAVGT